MRGSLTLGTFLFFLTAFLSISSGIIASSDGLTIFHVTQAIVERGEIAVGGENVAPGVGGRRYSPYGIGLSVVAIPLYLLGRFVATFVPEQFQALTVKGSVSLTNAVLSALVCLLLVKTGSLLGYSRRVALQLALAFAFCTFFVVYATKSFLTQPLETLCLIGTLYFLIAFSRASDARMLLYAGCFCGAGIVTKPVFIINFPVFLVYLLAISGKKRRLTNLALFSAPMPAFLGLALWYNYARFGSILNTGYPAANLFSTPLPVGLFGLLLSPGKSLFLYAPIALMGVAAFKAFAKSHKHELWMLLGLFGANVLVIAKLMYWSGEGSWGPRYLTLVLPCLVLPIGALLVTGSTVARRSFLALSLAGLLVQFGGISVYYGTYYRVIGEFPYRRSHSDPLFMHKVHYVPSYSPAWGHLTMAGQNWLRFFTGQRPTVTVGAGGERIPLSAGDIEKLRGTLDLWFAYAYYAGVPFSLCLLGMAGLLAAAGALGWRAYRSTGVPAG